MDRGDSNFKKPKDGGSSENDDLLSKLFELDESNSEANLASSQPFFGKTEINAAPNKSAVDKTKYVDELDALLSGDDHTIADLGPSMSNDHTEVLKKSPSSSALKVAPSAPQSNGPDLSKSFDFGDNLFDGILEDGTLSESKINFFEKKPDALMQPDQAATEASTTPQFGDEPTDQGDDTNNSRDHASSNPFGDQHENTVLLDRPVAEGNTISEPVVALKPTLPSAKPAAKTPVKPAAPDESMEDPIEKALREAFTDENGGGEDAGLSVEDHVKALKASLQNSPPTLQKVSAIDFDEPSLTPTHKREETHAPKRSEVSSNEFAEIFSGSSIPVADSRPSRISKIRFSTRALRFAALGFAAILFLSALAYGTYIFRSDDGLLGYRMDGFKVVRAYRNPASEQLKEFAGIFERARLARDSDDSIKIEESLSTLKGVLDRDERNLLAAALVSEHCALLSYWMGPASPWAQRYDESLVTVAQIKEHHPEPLAAAADSMARGRVWRSLSVHDFEKAIQEAGPLKGTSDDENLSVALQAAFEANRIDELKTILAATKSNPVKIPRGLLAGAVAELKTSGSDEALQKLSAQNYLPARVELLLHHKVTKDNSSALIKEATELLELARVSIPLQKRLLEFRGDLYASLDNGDKAREDWRLIVERTPRELDVWMKLSASYEEDALWDQAIDAYRSAQKAGTLKLENVIRFGRLLRVKGKVVEALTLLDQALTTYPKSAEIYYEEGRVQQVIYQDEAAKKSFTKALELDSKFENALLGIVDLAIQKKEFSEAEEYLQKIGPKSSNYADALRLLGQIAEMKHQVAAAEKSYRDALQVNPKLESIYPQLVSIYLSQERDHDAETLIERGLKSIPRSPLLKVSLAKVYQFQTRPRDAVNVLEPLHKNYDHLNEVLFGLADAYIDTKDFEKAWAILNPLIVKELRDSELLYLRAKAYYLDPDAAKFGGSTEGAARLIEQAVRRDSENGRYRLLAAQIALRNQDKAAAFEHIESVLRFQPDSALAYIVKGDIHMDNGEFEKANRAYQDALRLTRFQAPIYKRLGDSYKAVGKNSKAIEFYQKVVEQNPADARVFLTLGKLYNDDGRVALATQNFRKAMELNPELPEAYYYLGFLLKENGDRKGAVRNFERYLALEPSSKESATIKDEIYFLKGGTAN